MGIGTSLKRFFVGDAKKTVSHSTPSRSSRLDASRTTDENKKHWAEADGLSPTAQLTPDVRKKLRDRARYECQNNSYAAGLIRTLVADTIGGGPRLQMLMDDDNLNETIESLWNDWALATNLALSFRIMAGVRYVAGESFAVFRDSKRLENMGFPVTLDMRLIDPAQVASPYGQAFLGPTSDDGIDCDEEGEVVSYKILKAHPGDNRLFNRPLNADTVNADNVLHWYQPEWPGQLRGYTPLAPSLPIFAQLRRFTSATLTAAEVAAMLAGIMESDLPPDANGVTVNESNYFETVELVRGTLLTLPSGMKASQFKPEQPTTNYDMFINAKLRELGRSLNVPFGKMAGDHSNYNYSSGRLDDGPYWHDREIERSECEAKIFNRVFYRFMQFAAIAIPELAIRDYKPWQLKHSWHYDARPSSDPVKDATGDELNLSNATDTLYAIAARDGTTFQAILKQRKREIDEFEKLGLPLPLWATGAAAPVRAPQGEPTPVTGGINGNA